MANSPKTPNYRVPLEFLEAESHVDPEDFVEGVDVTQVEPDSRPPQPDRDWFASGG